MNEQTQSIYEAYQQVVNEATESKFKVGEKVGIGATSHHQGSDYHAIDTGTVTKVNKFGHHTVEYDTRKSQDNAFKPKVGTFNSHGLEQGSTGSFNGDHRLTSIGIHTRQSAATLDRQTRSRDLHQVQGLLDSHKLGSGHFTKLSKSSAERMKELIDLHTGEEA